MKENILNKLKKEHRQVLDLLHKISQVKEVETKKKLFDEVYKSLLMHMIGEEETIYQHLKKDTHDIAAEEVATEAEAEHEEIREILERLVELGPDSISFDEEIQNLQQVLSDHILEEESDLFVEAKDDFSLSELQHFAQEFEKAKQQIQL
jgi:hemerythrin superfamily protein